MPLEFESLDLVQGILPGAFPRATGGQGQRGTIVGSTQHSRHQQDLVPKGLQRGILELGR